MAKEQLSELSIEQLLKKLGQTVDQEEKKSIRRVLRNKGHVGGLRKTKTGKKALKKADKKKVKTEEVEKPKKHKLVQMSVEDFEEKKAKKAKRKAREAEKEKAKEKAKKKHKGRRAKPADDKPTEVAPSTTPTPAPEAPAIEQKPAA